MPVPRWTRRHCGRTGLSSTTGSPPLNNGGPPFRTELAGEARAAALLLAARCTDHDLVLRANQLCDQQTHFPQALHWDPLSIAQGDLGQALLCSELARVQPDGGWEAAAAAWVAARPACCAADGGRRWERSADHPG